MRLADETEEIWLASVRAYELEKINEQNRQILANRIRRHMRMSAALKQCKLTNKTLPCIIE